jgi:hypothetical protein
MRMNRDVRRGMLVLSVLFCAQLLHAKPMPSATWKEFCGARNIVEAKFLSYRRPSLMKAVGYFDPPIAEYQVVRAIRGKAVPEKIRVRYDFHDGSASLEPKEWRFSESLLPQNGSAWILFLAQKDGEIYQTYRGDFGRVPEGALAGFLMQECAKFWAGK